MNAVDHPQHYKLGLFEAIDVIESVIETIEDSRSVWLTASVLKYVIRWARKDGLQDLRKARWYLDRLISRLEHAGVAEITRCDQEMGLYDDQARNSELVGENQPRNHESPATQTSMHADLGRNRSGIDIGFAQRFGEAFGLGEPTFGMERD